MSKKNSTNHEDSDSDLELKKRSSVKKVVATGFNLLFPVKALYSSMRHFKKSTEQTVENAKYIKLMAQELINKNSVNKVSDESFDEAINRSSLTVNELTNIFVYRKNVYVFVIYFGSFLCFFSAFYCFLINNNKGFFLSLIGGVSIFCLFFLLSFSNQFRIWQLKVRRLSIKEKGGLKNFMSESSWIKDTLFFGEKVNDDE